MRGRGERDKKSWRQGESEKSEESGDGGRQMARDERERIAVRERDTDKQREGAGGRWRGMEE